MQTERHEISEILMQTNNLSGLPKNVGFYLSRKFNMQTHTLARLGACYKPNALDEATKRRQCVGARNDCTAK